MTSSLRVRMLVSAGLVLILFLGIMGAVLDNAFRVSAEQSVSERLLLQIYALIAASDESVEADASSLYLPEELQEPDFNNPGSGLFGVVLNGKGVEVWRSRSALGLTLTDEDRAVMLAKAPPGQTRFGQLEMASSHEALFFLAYRIIWRSGESDASYLYLVLQDFEPYRNEVRAFRNNLWGWLIAGVFVLVGVQAAIMYWGLRPVTGLEGDLKAIEDGRQEYLEGEYPREIAGVTRSLNILLADERRQREKYRTTLADLAHSLKTPLSILRTEAARPGLTGDTAASLNEQVDRMNDIVSYQLEKAVARSSLLYGASVEIKPLAEKLVNALSRVYQEKGVTITWEAESLTFSGDERDLYELLGNMLDNACKYGRHQVRLTVAGAGGRLRIVVEDDGQGIEPEDRGRILERGARLDSRETGQGIGLAVIAEIVERYSGDVKIGESALGGARISVFLG